MPSLPAMSSASVGANIRRVLSFGRKDRPASTAEPQCRSSNLPSATPSAPLSFASPLSRHATVPAQLTPEASAEPSLGKAKITRRALSFGRGKRGLKKEESVQIGLHAAGAKEESVQIGLHAAGAEAASRLTPSAGSSATPSRGNVHIKRTLSWQRGHRQSARATKATGEVMSRLLVRAAPALREHLPEQTRRAFFQVNHAVHSVSSASSSQPELPCIHFTHEGGAGGVGKENQDAWFVCRPSEDVAIFAVLDGHGKKHGSLASRTAAQMLKSFLSAHYRWLLHEPEECLRAAFHEAHKAIHSRLLRSDPSLREHGAYILQWMCVDEDEHGTPVFKWDAIDGGTTATVLAVLRGDTCVVASVGDSAAVMLSRDAAGVCRSELLLPEHSPTNLSEYVRMRALSEAKPVKFVYDCPDLEEFNIFCEDEHGHAKLDLNSQRLADEHEVMFKNGRDDRFTLVVIPQEELLLPKCDAPGPAGEAQATVVEEQMITMTRSLGDFYPHCYGVTWEPEVRLLPLSEMKKACTSPLILLASDGVWDIWDFDEVSMRLVAPHTHLHTSENLQQRATAFFEETRAKGCDYFGEAADNLTGLLVDLSAAIEPFRE